jgi:hypothetical protein
MKGLPARLTQAVNVPHTWNTVRALARYTGKAWYERRFSVSEEQLSKTIRVQFDAVYHDAFIYINGQKAGEYLGSGYNRFFVDASPFVRKGELDRIIGEYPGKSMTISEWGLCDPPQPGGDERRAREIARQMEIYGSKPYIAGAIYFCLNDYRIQRSENYSTGYPQRDHGVSDGYLNPKKSYETLKMVSSPLELKNVTRNDGKILVTVHGKKGISSYIVRNYTIVSGDQKVQIDELKPGEEKTFEISADSKEFGIFRRTGFEVLHVNL